MKRQLLSLLLALTFLGTASVPAAAAVSAATAAPRTAVVRSTTVPSTTAAAARPQKKAKPAAESHLRDLREIETSCADPGGRVLCAANEGMPRVYPEDSLSGIRACIEAGVDLVSVSVQETKDHKAVVLEDSSLSRMCTNAGDGSAARGKVSQYTQQELTTSFYLRSGHGGANRGSTGERIPTLRQAIQAAQGGCMLYIKNGWNHARLINQIARELDATDQVILGGATSYDPVQRFIRETGSPICHMAGLFRDMTADESAKSFASNALSAGMDIVLMESDKDYSSIFKESTIKQFRGKGRAMISATTAAKSGEHKDNLEGWEALIESGYSIIETDYPKELASYLRDLESYRSSLNTLIRQAKTVRSADYPKDRVKTFEKALEDAEALVSQGTVSRTQLDNARYALQESMDALDTGEAEVRHKTNPLTVVLVILLIIIVLAIVLYLRYRWKKNGRRPPKRPAPDPDEPDLRGLAAEATREVREEAHHLGEMARQKMEESRKSEDEPDAPPPDSAYDPDDGPSLFDQFDR